MRNFFRSLFGRKAAAMPPAAAAQPARTYPDSPNEPAQVVSPKVLLIIFNPILDPLTGRKLGAEMGWARPDDLVGRFIGDILQASAGLVRYQIAERIELDEFPALADGFRYDAKTYLGVLGGQPPHAPQGIDYVGLLNRFNVQDRVEHHAIDELWVMGFPYAGLYESVMAGNMYLFALISGNRSHSATTTDKEKR